MFVCFLVLLFKICGVMVVELLSEGGKESIADESDWCGDDDDDNDGVAPWSVLL